MALGRPAARPSGFGPAGGPAVARPRKLGRAAALARKLGRPVAQFSGWGGTIVSRATIVLRAGVLLNTYGGAKFFLTTSGVKSALVRAGLVKKPPLLRKKTLFQKQKCFATKRFVFLRESILRQHVMYVRTNVRTTTRKK